MKYRRPLAHRFWPKVRKTETCWLWTGARLTDGYGAFKVPSGRTSGAQQRAHRIAWELTHGFIPEGQQVLHACDTPLCVRPDHLFLGTNADNMADKVAKGRHRGGRGEANRSAKLTEADVRHVRVAAKTRLQRDIAQDYGLTQSAISDIIRRKTWSHVA